MGSACQEKLFESLICNAAIIGNSAVKETSKKYGVHVPWTILMDPTSACNLKCTGCWAAEYGHQMSMDLETLDRIITEAKALGIYMFIFSGGEPLVRKKISSNFVKNIPIVIFWRLPTEP